MVEKDERKAEVERDFEQLKKEIAQKGEEIEQLKKAMGEMKKQIQEKEKTGEAAELGKVYDDVSELLDIGFNIFGATSKIQGGKSKGKGLFGLVHDLSKMAKSETYEKTINLGKKGVAHAQFSVSSRPIRGAYATKPTSQVKITKPKKKTSPIRKPTPPATGPIKEREPIIDVFEEENGIRVTAELPNAKESEIRLKIENNTLTISTEASANKYHKQVKLPAAVIKDIIESNYKNGILEVKLKKVKNTGKTEKN